MASKRIKNQINKLSLPLNVDIVPLAAMALRITHIYGTGPYFCSETVTLFIIPVDDTLFQIDNEPAFFILIVSGQ